MAIISFAPCAFGSCDFSLHLSLIILPLSACLSVCLSNMLQGTHVHPKNATEQIYYFARVHSSFGPIHVLAFCLSRLARLPALPTEGGRTRSRASQLRLTGAPGGISFGLNLSRSAPTPCCPVILQHAGLLFGGNCRRRLKKIRRTTIEGRGKLLAKWQHRQLLHYNRPAS